MQISDLQAIQGVKIEYLSSEKISRIITSSMFLKEKFTAEGSFEKLKSRVVAGGHLKDRDMYDNRSSLISSTSSLDFSFSNEPSAVNFSFRNMLLVIILLICSLDKPSILTP